MNRHRAFVEGSLLHVACIARARLTASFWYYARIYLRGFPTIRLLFRLAHWVSVKSVVAVLMIDLLLWRTYRWGFIYLVLLLTPVGLIALLLRVCSRVARFIFWRLLKHFFLPWHAGVSLLHTIKSVVFLLDLLAGVCGKRYIKSASSEPMFSCIA